MSSEDVYVNKGVSLKFVCLHPEAILPKQNHSGDLNGDTGLDIFAVEDVMIPANGSAIIPTGLKVGHIDDGYWFRIEARSGLGFNYSVQPHAGVIDNMYRGGLGVKLYNLSNNDYIMKKGVACAQIVVYKLISTNVEWVDNVTETKRGEKGFGSSDC